MVYALALLLFSSLTCVGLLSIWVATSSHHWFWRTMLFLGVISLVLLIPAYEPFVAFLLQGVVVTAGVQLTQWWRERSTNSAERRTRYALRTILLAMIPLAIVSAVAVRLPELNFRAWQSVVLIGLCAGGATLVGLWIAWGRIVSWSWRMLIGGATAGTLSLLLMWGDWFIAAVQFWQWPPPIKDGETNPAIGFFEYRIVSEHHQSVWFLIAFAVACCIAAVLAIMNTLFLSDVRLKNRLANFLSRVPSCVCLLLIGLFLVVPPATVYYQLMNRLPIPDHESPFPNGYDDFVLATRLLPANPMVEAVAFDPDTASLAQLKSALSEAAPSLGAVRKGLAKQVWKPLDFSRKEGISDTLMGLRTIMRSFIAAVVEAEKTNNPTRAANFATELICFGNCLTRGAIVDSACSGIATSQAGCWNLYQIVEKVPTSDCVRVISALANCESLLDSPEDILHRQRVWTQHVMGWTVHLGHILIWSTGETRDSYDIFGYATIDDCHRALIRLLQVEFALRAWKAEQGEWPETLAALVPKLIPALPVDPFSPDGKVLQYVRADEGYVLYSVGRNQIDEGGQPPEESVMGWWGPETGDLRLDIHFAPDPPANVGTEDEDVEGE